MSDLDHQPLSNADSAGETPGNIVDETVRLQPVNVFRENAFASPAPPATAGVSQSDGAKEPIPGPGLGESLLWTLSCPVVQMVASIGFLLVMGVWLVATQGGITEEALRNVQSNYTGALLGCVQLCFVLYALLAVTLRVGRPWANRLNLSPIDPLHFVLMVVLILPLAMTSGGWYAVASEVWGSLVEAFPGLSVMDSANTMNQMTGFAESMSLPLMLMVVAVAPALGEELIFRGLIGRGLIARWGMIKGILLTSLLFAAVHLHPAHAFGVIPLGIAMHVVYVTTKSFWAPVFLHFANNAMSTISIKAMDAEQLQKAAEVKASIPVIPLVFGMIAVVTILTVMWQSRVRHRLSDQTEWNPGYPTVERPPMNVQATVARNPAHWAGLVAVCLTVLMFFIAMAWHAAQQAL